MSQNKFTRRQLLITSAACGVVCTFGAPYGGILISVELCASVYLLSNLFKAYVCGTVAFVVYQQFHQFEGYFDDYKKEVLINRKAESLIHFVVLGIIIGYIGSFLIFLSGKLLEMKNSSNVEFLKNRYLFTPIAAIIVSLITFFHPAFWYGNKHIMIDLFNRESLVSDSASGIWKDGDPITLLFSCAIIRFIIFLFIVLTPVPSGVFAPALVLGGIIGRLFAGIVMNRRMMAVAGAAAFTGVISKTTSPILILLEMTGDMEYLSGLLVTLLVANSIAGIYTMSFFDTVLNIRKLPYLPVLFSSMWYKRSAAEVMEPQKYCIYKNANLIDLLAIISSNDKIDKESYIAVLESPDNPVLIGSFKVKQAFNYLEAEVQEIENKLKTGIANSDYRFQKFFQSLKNETGMEISTAGDSSVIQMSDQLRNFLKEMVIFETKFHYDKDGKIIEEKVLVGKEPANPKSSLNQSGGEGRQVNQTIEAIIKEIKVESEKKRKYDRERAPTQMNMPGRKVSKRQIIFKKEVRLEHPALQLNSFPISVRLDTKLVKVHYLFEMLGTSWIFVRGEKEHLKGHITKQAFLNLRYSLQIGL